MRIAECYQLDSLCYNEIKGTNISDVTCNKAVTIIQLENELERIKKQYHTLNDNERKVLELSSAGYSKSDIASVMNYSVDNIYKIYTSMRFKLDY